MNQIINEFNEIKKDFHLYRIRAIKRLEDLKKERQEWHDKINDHRRSNQLNHLDNLIKKSGDHISILWHLNKKMKKIDPENLTSQDKLTLKEVINILNKWFY